MKNKQDGNKKVDLNWIFFKCPSLTCIFHLHLKLEVNEEIKIQYEIKIKYKIETKQFTKKILLQLTKKLGIKILNCV